MTEEELEARVAYLRGRVENAERIGRPQHIERCRSRLEAAETKLRAIRSRTGGAA